VRSRYTAVGFFWPSRWTLPMACRSIAGFLRRSGSQAALSPLQRTTGHRSCYGDWQPCKQGGVQRRAAGADRQTDRQGGVQRRAAGCMRGRGLIASGCIARTVSVLQGCRPPVAVEEHQLVCAHEVEAGAACPRAQQAHLRHHHTPPPDLCAAEPQPPEAALFLGDRAAGQADR
jgi:hypothetical protein